MFAYRTSVQESTGCTPFQLVFGREVRLPIDRCYVWLAQPNKYAVDHLDRVTTKKALWQIVQWEAFQDR